MLDTWGQLLTLAVVLSIFALWRLNLLLSIVSSAGWFGFLYYHLGNQPPGITAGDTTDTFIIWAVAIVAIAIPIITISRMRGRETGRSLGSMEGDKEKVGLNRASSPTSMTTDEYKAYIRSKTRRKK